MKKLILDVNEIAVSSFVADEYEDVRGTVLGNDQTPRCQGTVMFAGGEDDCTSGCVCCRFRPAPRPRI